MAGGVGEFGDLVGSVAGETGGDDVAHGGVGETGVEVGPAAAGEVGFYPPVVAHFGDEGGVVEGVAGGRAGRDGSQELGGGGEHAGDEGLGIGGVQGSVAVAGGDAAGAEHGDEEAGLVGRIAGIAPQSSPRPPQGA